MSKVLSKPGHCRPSTKVYSFEGQSLAEIGTKFAVTVICYTESVEVLRGI